MRVDCRFLVIGAGPTGIGAATRLAELGEDYVVVDSNDYVGGMAASIRDDAGFNWDLGGHVLHSHFPQFDQAIKNSGVAMNTITRNGWVWIDGKLVPAPIQKNLDELPSDLRPYATSANLEEYYRNRFGTKLYNNFFEPYTVKMWTTPLNRVDHEWTSLRNGSRDRNIPNLGLSRDFVPSTDQFPYPVGGTGALWRGISAKLLDPDRILLGSSVIGLRAARRVALLSNGVRVHYEHCISTVPITQMASWANRHAGRGGYHFVSSKVYAIGLGFRAEPPETLADKTWLYCPDTDVPWYRATMLSNYDADNAGTDRWNVLCEVSTSRTRPIELQDAIRRTTASIGALGADLSKLEHTWHREIQMGYPVPTLGRDRCLRRIDESLREVNIRSRGRFGGWRYESCNQDYSYVQGQEAVDSALYGSQENVYWNPEDFCFG